MVGGAVVRSAQAGDERARRRHLEVRVERGAVGPVLDEDEPVRVLDVAVHGVQQAARLRARTVYVFETQAQRLVEGVGTGLHGTGDDDHVPVLAGRAVTTPRSAGGASPTARAARPQTRRASRSRTAPPPQPSAQGSARPRRARCRCSIANACHANRPATRPIGIPTTMAAAVSMKPCQRKVDDSWRGVHPRARSTERSVTRLRIVLTRAWISVAMRNNASTTPMTTGNPRALRYPSISAGRLSVRTHDASAQPCSAKAARRRAVVAAAVPGLNRSSM